MESVKPGVAMIGRSPSGERGLKWYGGGDGVPVDGRSPSGERGLKFPMWCDESTQGIRRSPSGERGLKSAGQQTAGINVMSLPIRGAWIEINTWCCRASAD